ncbi:MAG: cysteine desulfurase family protein [Candidatus Coproplasma sp.]
MIYLDNAATTPLDEDILQIMTPYLKGVFGNASSQHSFGREAANAVVSARDKIANILGVKASEIYFTSGGTEADNLAVKGVCLANADRGKHLVVSSIEHPAVIESAKDLRPFGFEVTFVDPDKDGVITPQSVETAMRPDTTFVAVMSANNETGVIQPIKEIYKITQAHGAFLWCDCVQSAGVLDFKNFPSDGKAISSHKFYGPKGFGAAYIRSGTRFNRLLSGGMQERSMRGGTTFVAGAVGCAAALEKACAQRDTDAARISALRDYFAGRVLSEISGTRLNGVGAERLPSNANISFEGCDGENILFLLDLNGVAVSTGSACSSGAVTPSHVLTAMGLSESQAKSSVRFTFGKYNTREEADRAVEILKSAVGKIRGNSNT